MPLEPYSVRIERPAKLAGLLRLLLHLGRPVMAYRSKLPGSRMSESDLPPIVDGRRLSAAEAEAYWAEARNPTPGWVMTPMSLREASRRSGIPYPRMRALVRGEISRVRVGTFSKLIRWLDSVSRVSERERKRIPNKQLLEFTDLYDAVLWDLADEVNLYCHYPTENALKAGKRHSKRVRLRGLERA